MTLRVEKDEFVGDWVVVSDIVPLPDLRKADPHILERFDNYQDAIEFKGRNEMHGTKFAELEKLIEAVQDEMLRLTDEASSDEKTFEWGMIKLPHEIRWKLHVLACSMEDYTFWAYKLEEGKEWYRVYEVETGVWAEGVSPRHALENYFSQDFPDVLYLPRKGSDADS